MALKSKAPDRRHKVSRQGTKNVLKQASTSARRKTKPIPVTAKAAVDSASEWVGERASRLGTGVKRQTWLMSALAVTIGVIGWAVGLRSSR